MMFGPLNFYFWLLLARLGVCDFCPLPAACIRFMSWFGFWLFLWYALPLPVVPPLSPCFPMCFLVWCLVVSSFNRLSFMMLIMADDVLPHPPRLSCLVASLCVLWQQTRVVLFFGLLPCTGLILCCLGNGGSEGGCDARTPCSRWPPPSLPAPFFGNFWDTASPLSEASPPPSPSPSSSPSSLGQAFAYCPPIRCTVAVRQPFCLWVSVIYLLACFSCVAVPQSFVPLHCFITHELLAWGTQIFGHLLRFFWSFVVYCLFLWHFFLCPLILFYGCVGNNYWALDCFCPPPIFVFLSAWRCPHSHSFWVLGCLCPSANPVSRSAWRCPHSSLFFCIFYLAVLSSPVVLPYVYHSAPIPGVVFFCLMYDQPRLFHIALFLHYV